MKDFVICLATMEVDNSLNVPPELVFLLVEVRMALGLAVVGRAGARDLTEIAGLVWSERRKRLGNRVSNFRLP